jgi:hypothetical protein
MVVISYTQADTTPPTTTISLNGQNGWYTSAVTLTISAMDPDNAPGTLQTRCALDPSSPPANFAALPSGACPSSVSSNGQHILYAASIDPAGNAEAVQSMPFKIDTTAPPSVRPLLRRPTAATSGTPAPSRCSSHAMTQYQELPWTPARPTRC